MVDAFTYHSDALGRRTQRSDYYNDRVNNPSTTVNTFGYNTFSEVTNVNLGANNEYAYDYDPIGNRVEYIENSSTTDYSTNGLNQYTSIDDGTAVSPTYDDDGNMLTNSTHAFEWDAENRLLTASNLTTAVVCNFIYDHQSRRISKTTLTPNPSSSLTSKFTYEGWNLIGEVIDDQTKINTNIFVCGLDLSGTLQGAGGVGGLLSQTIITPATVKSYFPLADANGNAVAFIDNAGNVQAHYTYDAFGGTVSSDGAMDDDFRFRFSSKYLDDETEFYYYGYRYDSPALGRWLSRDPIGERGGLLLYGFVGNNGANFVDKLGLYELMEDYINCIGHATGVGCSLQPRDDSLSDTLKALGWNCSASQNMGNDCDCDCDTESAIMVYVYIKKVKTESWEKLPLEDKIEDFKAVAQTYEDVDLWNDVIWPGDAITVSYPLRDGDGVISSYKTLTKFRRKGPNRIDFHGIKRNCSEEDGSTKGWEYVGEHTEKGSPKSKVQYTSSPAQY